MKKLLTVSFVLSALLTCAQPNTEVYLLDVIENNGKIEFSNLRNISNNEGYDNQPSFYDDNLVLFSSTRNRQTDIAKYDITTEQITWLTNTPGGSEYSPLRIPGSDEVSAIRLDDNGLQRLYRYNTSSGKSEELLKDLKIGYHVWYSDHILVSTVLIEDRMDLVVSNMKDNTNYTIQKNVGRSLHNIPKCEEIYFIAHEMSLTIIKSLHPITRVTKPIHNLPGEVSDFCLLPDGHILYAKGKNIFRYDPYSKKSPKILHLFQDNEINAISRMAVSPDGKHMAIVSEESAARIVQKQVDSYNARDLDAFVSCYAEDVVVSNFPNDTLYVGREKMRSNYKSLSTETDGYKVEVTKRIQIGNKVIDQEKVTGFGKTSWQAAIYEVANGTLASMTFIHDKKIDDDPEIIVQKQLDAYNSRNIDAFVATYSDDAKVFDFPYEMRFEGSQKMREGYAGFFEKTLDLHCEIKNRMVVGNKVIDEEYLTINGQQISVVAIYEVENGKIAKVTFLR